MNDSIQNIQKLISTYLLESQRSLLGVRLIAVSKTRPASDVRKAFNLGLRDFGENYADELAQKQSELAELPGVTWIFIGQLQSNKIQKIVHHADEIQSLASEKHARYIQRYVELEGKRDFPVWIAINAANEASKQGVSLSEAPKLARFISEQCPSLVLQGVMAIPPSEYSDDEWFKENRDSLPELYQDLRNVARTVGLGKLSLGMSGDLKLAIHAGSDCVRIGTAIFGSRSK